MKDFKKNVEIKFEVIKDNIQTVILKMKNDTEEEIKNLLILKNQNLKGLNSVNQNMRKFILILMDGIFQMGITII